jgi:hypothetical protein
MHEDKIINNSYNTGALDFEAFSGQIKVHNSVTDLYQDQLSDDLIEYRTLKMLEEELYELFEKSPYFNKYKKTKRVDKNELVQIYYYFKERLTMSKKYSSMEMFIGIAEFFQINYEQLYQSISVLDKEALLRELSEKYGLNDKIKCKKLF